MPRPRPFRETVAASYAFAPETHRALKLLAAFDGLTQVQVIEKYIVAAYERRLREVAAEAMPAPAAAPLTPEAA